jgi:hypothetical protein
MTAHLTIVKATQPDVVCKRYTKLDGRLRKEAVAFVTEGRCRTVPVPDAAAMLAVLADVTRSRNLCIVPGVWNGADDETFELITEAALAHLTGSQAGVVAGGVHIHNGRRVAARLRRGIEPSAWLLIDADNPPGMPQAWQELTLAERLTKLEPLIPGISVCERIELRGSSARVSEGDAAPGTRTHAWLRVNRPDLIETMKTWVEVCMVTEGLAFSSPRHSRKDPGTVVGYAQRTVIDLSVWTTGRLVFNAEPALGSGMAGYRVADAGIIVVNEGGGMLDISRVQLPEPPTLETYRRKTGVRLDVRRDCSGIKVVSSGELTLDTPIERRCQTKPLRDWAAAMKPGDRLRCEAPFRASASEAAFIKLPVDGRQPFVHDVGNSTTYILDDQMSTQRPDNQQPLNIFRELVAPPLRPEDFPPILANFATLQARAAGHDANGYLLAALVAAAGIVSDEVRVSVDPRISWSESPRLWGLLLGPPGSAKTPAIRAAMGAHQELQRELRRRHEIATAGLADGERKPAPQLVFSNDATIEAMSDILAATPRGLLSVCEELDSWLGAHDAYRGGQGSKDRGEWLRLFDGGPHQVDRIRRGSVYVTNWGVSLLGATTPAGLRRHAKNLPPDGLIQRFLVVLMQHPTERDLSIGAAEVRTARDAWERRLRELHALPACTVRMMPEALEILQERHAAMRRECSAAAGLSEPFAGHLAKHPGLLARVALVHHCLLNGAAAGEVPLVAESVLGAIGILRRLARHALVMFDTLADRGGALPLARAVGAMLVVRGLDIVHRRDLIHRCRAFRDASEIEQESALRLLVDAAWLTPVDDARQYRGRPASFSVHPQVPVLFAATGQALLERRRAVQELLAE